MDYKKGQIKFAYGIRFVFNGEYWVQDSLITNIIDRHHTYTGHQDPKKPYRGAKAAHCTCGAKLCR